MVKVLEPREDPAQKFGSIAHYLSCYLSDFNLHSFTNFGYPTANFFIYGKSTIIKNETDMYVDNHE